MPRPQHGTEARPVRGHSLTAIAALLALLATTGAPLGAATLELRVRALSAPVPEVPPVSLGAFGESCGPSAPGAVLIGPDGGLDSVVATLVTTSARGSRATTVPEVVLDQIGCRFVPHIVVVGQRRPLRVRSSDPVIHSAHAYTANGHRERFNLGFPAGGGERVVQESLAGPLVVRCDAGHPWMSAFVYIAPGDSFAKTDPTGLARIEGVRPVPAQLTLWHEKLGALSLLVDLSRPEGARVEADVEFLPTPTWGAVRGARLAPP